MTILQAAPQPAVRGSLSLSDGWRGASDEALAWDSLRSPTRVGGRDVGDVDYPSLSCLRGKLPSIPPSFCEISIVARPVLSFFLSFLVNFF